MILTIEEAREKIRISGTDNDIIIQSLIDSIPAYIEVATGKDWTKDKDIHPIVKTTAGFILQLWYYPQREDSERLMKAIVSLLTTLSVMARNG